MYTFDIVGVSPVLYFFNHQQEQLVQPQKTGVTYVSSYECSLDALIKSVESTTFAPDWAIDDVVQSVLDFWLDGLESVKYWKQRLQDEPEAVVLVSRVADDRSLRNEWDCKIFCVKG
jgi:hypothetical protein